MTDTPQTGLPSAPAPEALLTITPSPRRVPLVLLVAVALLGAAAGAAGTYVWLGGSADVHKGAQHTYQCPMHPTVVQDHPGDCPICGMKLVPTDEVAPSATVQKYQCPMHPGIVQDHPGDCPICGMKLVPMEDASPRGERKIAFYRSPMDPTQTSPAPAKDSMGMDYVPVYQEDLRTDAPAVDGLAPIKVDPERQQLIGLRTQPVTRGPIGGAWRTTGRVVVDETRVHHLNLRFAGITERVFADYVGRPVRRGEPLFSMYSPDLLAAEQEFVSVLRMRDKPGGEAVVNAARRKLVLWDVPSEDIANLEKTGVVERTITLRAPASGVVVKKGVVPGMSVAAGEMPYEIVDLSTIWVMADVYEREIRHVKVGAPASLFLKALPDTEYQGKVAFMDPFLDPKTRSVRVRLSFPNPGELRPEMVGEVVLRTTPHDALRIPVDAVIDSGTRSVVFVAQGQGKFTPREVRLGLSDGDLVEVVAGVDEGERVVTRANFLVDSESRLKASLQALSSGGAR